LPIGGKKGVIGYALLLVVAERVDPSLKIIVNPLVLLRSIEAIANVENAGKMIVEHL